MKKIIILVGAMLVWLPGMALGQQIARDKPQTTGKCWKIDLRSGADFYAKGWAMKNDFVGIVLLDGSMRYVKEGRIKQITPVDCTSAEIQN